MNEINKSTSSGVNFSDLLTLMLIFLKLTGKITWPWLWILAPQWVSAIVVVLIFILVLLFGSEDD